MKIILLFLLTTLSYFAFGQTTTNKTKKLRILVYGLPNFKKQNAENVVSDKYGFYYYSVGGCIVSQELADSVGKENKPVYALIEKRYGKNFWTRYRKEVDEEFEHEERVKKLLSTLSYLNEKNSELQKEGNGLEYSIYPLPGNKYSVDAFGWGKVNNEDALLIYYRMIVRLNTKTVQLKSNKPEPFKY